MRENSWPPDALYFRTWWLTLTLLSLSRDSGCAVSLRQRSHSKQHHQERSDGLHQERRPPTMHTLFSVECNNYFDWQTVGLMNSYKKSGHPGPITRLLSCTDDQLETYRGMHLAPTHVVPSMSRHPETGDWYPAINKPAGVLHWLQNSPEAKTVEWIVILDADMIIRKPIVPWELGVEKGRPVSALYGYLIGCDNILAKLHTKHPELCDKVGGLLVMHMDDLRELAPLWLSKTEEVRADKEHWATNITGDIYASGWISEMYGYSFGAAEVGLRHQIRNDLMIYPGYIPQEGVHPLLMHYGLKFSVGSWSFSKADHHDDDIVYKCNKLFPAPPYPKEVLAMEPDPNRRRGLFLSIECMNSLNEGLLETHRTHGCPKPSQTRYIRFLKIWRRSRKTFSEFNTMNSNGNMINDNGRRSIGVSVNNTLSKNNSPSGFTVESRKFPKIHTLFSTECSTYFDWQTVGLIHSFAESGQPGSITRLLSCSDEQLKTYKGMDLAPTHVVPSYSLHPLTNDWYPAINKPASVLHWINHVPTDAEFLVILDADMVLRRPITPWEFGAEKGRPVSVPYLYLIGCDNELAKLHTRFPEACEKVGGIIIMHIDDLRSFAPLWLHKTEEVRADKDHWAVNFTGDIYGQGWISEMYGYSFGAAELRLRHIIRNDIMLYPGYPPPKEMEPHVLHYGLEFSVGNWSFDKAKWRDEDMTNVCWKFFPDPPNPAFLNVENLDELRRDTISIECVRTLNEALYLHHKRRGCHPSVNEDVVMVLNTANTEGIDSTGMIQNSRNTKLGDSMINDEADANYTSKRINEGENGSEEENGEVDNDWDSRGFQREKPHDWQYLGTDSNFKTANRKFSDLTGNIAELRISPKHSTTPLWSVSVLLFVLLTLYVYSSRCWLTSKKTKSKPRRLGLNASLIGKAHRTASTAE